MTLDRNTYPYNDDFDPTKGYYQLLFRPSTAVQARELSQIQSTLQNQIKNLGSFTFKEGSQVLPGECGINLNYPYIKLQDTFSGQSINVQNFIGKTIQGVTSGTIATVVDGLAIAGTDPNTLYLKLGKGSSSQVISASIGLNSNTVNNVSVAATTVLAIGASVTGAGIPSNTYITGIVDNATITMSNPATATNTTASLTIMTNDTFVDGETITTVEASPLFASLQNTGASGTASLAFIKQGVYFVKGFFVLVEDQNILLDKYDNTPSYNIGLTINDSFVTASDDPTLVDPAGGSPNFNAPGADRYHIELTLTKNALGTPASANFIQLIQINQGVIQILVNSPQYSELEKTLASRTYDANGDFTVNPFVTVAREHLNDGTNGGVYTPGQGGDDSKIVLAIGPSKAYVQGFQIKTQATQFLPISKPRTTLTNQNATFASDFGSFVQCDHATGSFEVSTFEQVNLVDVGSTTVGTARVRSVEFVSGTPGTTGAVYNVYLFNVAMNTGHNFSEVVTISTTGKAVKPINTATLQEVSQSALLVQLPEYAIKTFKPAGTLNTSYIVERYLSGTMSGSSITFTSNTNEVFEAGNILTYQMSLITASSTATGNSFSNGSIINLQASGNTIVLGGSPTGKQVTITVPTVAGSVVAVLAQVKKTLSAEKTKTLVTNTETIAFTNTIQLSKADIYSITSIVDSHTSLDITSQFKLDNGQRDNYYDRGSLSFNTAYPAPTVNVIITYQFFNHGNGDYFSVDSYNGVIDYADIPLYNSTTNGITYSLVNCLDFRPRVNDAGTGYSVFSELPLPGEDIECSYDYYLARIDKLYLSPNGTFNVITGTPAITPLAPKSPDVGMVLYQVTFPPYTFSAADVILRMQDNKRYTMRDIGSLDTRITNLESYTSLSLLEQSAADNFIDDGTGANRFKNGIMVDNFTSHANGAVNLIEYQCAIDPQNGYLRPQFNSDNVGLTVDPSNSQNYEITGNLLTLPYTSALYIQQPYCSLTENVNPYAVYNWIGNMVLNPSSDDWYEKQVTATQTITDDDGLANAYASLNGQVIWNDWVTTWVGQAISSAAADSGTSSGASRLDNAFLQTYGRLPDQIQSVSTTDDHVIQGTFNNIVSRQVGQTRTGTQYSTVTSTSSQVINEQILGTSVIPYMRANTVNFSVQGLKPNTLVYAFFDNIPVSQLCRPTGSMTDGTALISDNNGALSGTFDIPDTDALRFQTGAKQFILIDDVNNDTGTATTSATAIYTAAGVLQSVDDTILSTTTSQLVQTTVTQNQVVVGQFQETTTGNVSWADPLAQSFLIGTTGGIFLQRIEVFFDSVDNSGIPVTIQIRNMVNGTPGTTIVPYSVVTLNPNQITTSADGSVATGFVFPSPVYLQDGTEYCFVLMSNSNQYHVWCSELGQTDTVTGGLISQQPYAGVLFKSQNASTWTASQEEDIKFNIYNCIFNTAVNSHVQLNSGSIDPLALFIDPLTTATGTKVVTVYHPNHALQTGQKTTITGVPASTTQNGIPSAELNGLHTVTFIDLDNYSFTVSTTNATATGSCGGATVFATHNLEMDLANVNVNNVIVPDTNIAWTMKNSDAAGSLDSAFSSIVLNQNLTFNESKLVLSQDNTASPSSMVQGTLTSTVNTLSPVIDVTRASIIAVSNRINDLDTNESHAQSGNALARYITKQVTLANSAEGATVYVTVVRPAGADVEVWIKYLDTNTDGSTFDSLPYTQLTATNYPSIDPANFYDYQFDIHDLQPFNVFAIKIVMLASDTSEPPVLKQLRVIATGS